MKHTISILHSFGDVAMAEEYYCTIYRFLRLCRITTLQSLHYDAMMLILFNTNRIHTINETYEAFIHLLITYSGKPNHYFHYLLLD